MRILGIVLALMLVAIQYPLWFGKGGWLRVWELDRQLTAQRATNRALAARNAEAAAEVASLREGNEAIAERARYQLNMLREGEVLFQFVGRPEPSTSAPRPRAEPPARQCLFTPKPGVRRRMAGGSARRRQRRWLMPISAALICRFD